MKNSNAVSLGSLGGKASAKSLTKAQRVARAKKAIATRWANKKTIQIGLNNANGNSFTVHQVLHNGKPLEEGKDFIVDNRVIVLLKK